MEHNKQKQRQLAQTALMQDFDVLMRAVSGQTLPEPSFCQAHRWGAAMPQSAMAVGEPCMVDPSLRLVACGDYMVSPKVEGAAISACAAVDAVLELLEN